MKKDHKMRIELDQLDVGAAGRGNNSNGNSNNSNGNNMNGNGNNMNGNSMNGNNDNIQNSNNNDRDYQMRKTHTTNKSKGSHNS